MMGACRFLLVWGAVMLLAGCTLLVSDETCTSDVECASGSQCAEEGFCVALDNPGCERIGSQDEGALVLGFIMTFSGPYAESGTDQRKVVDLALAEINAKGGIQGLQGKRELAFLACDDKADKDQTRAAATYLTKMGVPAILGPGFSSLLEVSATEVVIPSGTFTVSPSSTAVSIRDLEDDDPGYAALMGKSRKYQANGER